MLIVNENFARWKLANQLGYMKPFWRKIQENTLIRIRVDDEFKKKRTERLIVPRNVQSCEILNMSKSIKMNSPAFLRTLFLYFE